MGNIVNKKLILDRIKEAYGLSGNSELARFLGVAPNTITNWYNRNSIDFDLVFPKCESIDFNWLITGKGPMLKKEQKEPRKYEDEGLIRELIEKNGELRQLLGKHITENEILKVQIEKLKKKEQNKSTERHPVYSSTDIAAEPEG